ncbi:hypothetical protein [Helicobacter bilis]|uniref:hypothetical protein n=1 Tax=Helicobacter bilis TaxID=37372 RepID=UPI0025AA2114|nr:hypothetical protein [Helicobacter bilis]
MASVVFEKQLANIQKGLQTLRSMNKELNKFEKGSNSTKMLKGAIKSLKEAESSVKSMALEAHMLNFDKAHKSLNRFNNGLQHTKKYLDSIYGKLKMIGFASMAGIGSIAAMGAAMGSGAKSQVAHTTKAKTLSNMSGRSLDIFKQMGKKQGDENLIVGMYENLLNAADNGSIALSTFDLNQDDIIKGLNSTNIQDRVKTLDKVVKALEGYKDYTKNSHFNDLSQELLGVGIREAVAYRERAGGSFTDQFNAIRAKTNKTTIYKDVEAVGQAFIDLQYQISQFGDWLTSNFQKGLTGAFGGLETAFDIMKNDKEMKAYLNVLSAGAAVKVPQIIGNVFEAIMNIPNYFESIKILLNKIVLGAESIKNAIFYSFADLGERLSQVEWWFPGVGKFNPFGTLKPSDESLANMYGDKFANAQSKLNNLEADNKNLQSYMQHNKLFFSLTKDEETQKELQEKIAKNNATINDLKAELKNIQAQAVINGLEIHVNTKEENIEIKQKDSLKNTLITLVKSPFRK